MKLSRATVLRIAAAIVALAAFAGVSYVSRAYAPTTIATTADLAAQRASAERTIDKVYKFGLEQLKTTRGLKLAITDAQAGAIEQKYAGQLRDLRRAALQAIADTYAMSAADASAYIQQAEQRLDAGPQPSAAPVMLAPRLYQIVQRMADLGGQLTDAGIREMTQSPSASPRPSPTVIPSARPSPSPTR